MLVRFIMDQCTRWNHTGMIWQEHYGQQSLDHGLSDSKPGKTVIEDLIKRIQVTHSLVLHYNLHKKMNLYRPRMATKSDLCTFHSQEYIDFLSRVTTENMSSYTRELEKFSVGLANGDTPLFGGKVFLRPYSHFTHPLSKPPLFSIFGNFQAGIRYWQTVFVLCSLMSLVTRKDYNL